MIGPKITTSRLIFAASILFVFTATAFEYVYADDPRNKPAIDKLLEKNRQVIDKNAEKLKEKIGTRYWVLKNDQIKFYKSPVLFSKYFFATQTQSFVIKEWLSVDKNYSHSGSFYKVEFESGDVSYVRADTFSTYWALYEDFLRTGDPQTIEEELKIEAAKKDAYEFSLKQEQEKRRQEEEKIKLDEKKKKKEEMDRKEAEKKSTRQQIKTAIGEKLSANYTGHEIHDIFKEAMFSKKEFEKTEDFEKRLAMATGGKIYAFRITAKDAIDIEYDSDREAFNIEIKPLVAFCRGAPETENLSIIPVKNDEENATSYIGSNAFGAKVIVNKFERQTYGIKTRNSTEFDNSYTISLDMPIKDAKKYKDLLSVLLICKPLVKNNVLGFPGLFHIKPEFNNPIEISYMVWGLNTDLLEIWIYDFKTGTVFKRVEFY